MKLISKDLYVKVLPDLEMEDGWDLLYEEVEILNEAFSHQGWSPCLTGREYAFLSLRYNLSGGVLEDWPMPRLCERFCITPKRALEIEEKAIRGLRRWVKFCMEESRRDEEEGGGES